MDPNATTTVPVEKEVQDKNPPSTFEGIDMSPERHENELYCDYRCRKWWINRLVKFYLKGRPIWQGHMGTRHGSFSVG